MYLWEQLNRLWLRWRLTSLPNQLLVIASVLMAFGTLVYGGVTILQYRILQQQSEITKSQLAAMQKQSDLMQSTLNTLQDQSNSTVYLRMRDRYFDVWSQLPNGYEKLDVKRDDKNWPRFKQYWYVTFDEWYVMKKIGAFNDLWSGYYEYAYARTLAKPSMRLALCELRHREFNNTVGKEFVSAMEVIHSRHDTEPMCK